MTTMPDVTSLKIADFSPNCLMGACEAIARAMHRVPNLDRLFFNSSFSFKPDPSGLGFTIAPVLNSAFSRALPLEKSAFLERLEYCYGITLFHKGYEEFADLTADLEVIAAQGLPVISEVDFFHMPGHPFFGKVHDGHMMIVCGKGQKADTLSVVDAVFGQSVYPLNILATCFEDRQRQGRPFYLMHVRRDLNIDRPLPKEAVLSDLAASLENLLSEASDQGLQALAAFCEDIDTFVREQKTVFLIPGFWALMCNAKNNQRFLDALEPAMKMVAEEEIAALQKHMGWLYKRWFMLNLTIEAAVSEEDVDSLLQLPQGLADVALREEQTPELIGALLQALKRG